MIEKVTFLVKSRELARLVAKQLVMSHCASHVEIVQCDVITNDTETVLEFTRSKVICLTGSSKTLIDMLNTFKHSTTTFEYDQLRVEFTHTDENSEKDCNIWCRTEDNKSLDTEQVEEKVSTSQEVENTEQQNTEPTEETSDRPKIKRVRKKKESVTVDENLTDATSEKSEPSEESKVEEVETSDTETDQPKKKRERKLPKWAEEAGLTLSEYGMLSSWKTAAKWGMTYPEYCTALSDARKLNMEPRKYLERIGKVHNPELDTSYITLDYIKSQKETEDPINISDIIDW